MDRCYRIGQSKDVTVIKYYCSSTYMKSYNTSHNMYPTYILYMERCSMHPSIEVPMMILQASKGALSHCSIKEKGKKMLKLAHGLTKYV